VTVLARNNAKETTMNVRKGKTVAKVGEYQGRPCTQSAKDYDSINQAKKANGLNARTLKRGEAFPLTEAEIDAAIKLAA
jgi:hypothetical protein